GCASNDDDYIRLTQNITLPDRTGTGCFTTTSNTEIFEYIAENGATTTDPDGLNCGSINDIWTFTITSEITYDFAGTPEPAKENYIVGQCLGMTPLLGVIPTPGIIYVWQNGAGTGTVSGSQNEFYTPGPGEFDLLQQGTYIISVQAIHPCDNNVRSLSTEIRVSVIANCPELLEVSTSSSAICSGESASLNATIKPDPCGGKFTEGADYLIRWYLNDSLVLDGLGPDGKFGTADDRNDLSITTYSPVFAGRECSVDSLSFEARLYCIQNAQAINLGVRDAFCSSTLKSQYGGYEKDVNNGFTNGCPGLKGSEGPLNMEQYFDPCTGEFDFDEFRTEGDPAQFQLDLSFLPSCAEVARAAYIVQGNTRPGCNSKYELSWASEANLVFYNPTSSPGSVNTP
ncbi:MAG TPA: hypothetical protein VEB42_03755, partial [Chitinophagaceae bacterium]|nr:hypothetical protein [Chitinophagaceae bacterium]